MQTMRKMALVFFLCAVGLMTAAGLAVQSLAGSNSELQTQESAPQNPAATQVGTIKAINGNTVTLGTDAGAEFSVLVQNSTRVVRVAPGQTDLKNATPIQLPDLQVGDRILVRGKNSGDTRSLAASIVIVMKGSDIEAKQEHDREDWQKRGVVGLVSAVDSGAGNLTISVVAPGGTKAITIHSTKNTILRHYASDSVKFEEARLSTWDQIKTGDQLRARGTLGADGTEFAAEEIVSGSFRNIAGTITSIDAVSSTITVVDLTTKKPVLVRVTSQSQILKLPLELAQRIAMRLKGAVPGTSTGTPPGGSGIGAGGPGTTPELARQGGGEQRPGGTSGNPRPVSAQADFQQAVNSVPPAKFSDLQKGDAVMIVSTYDADSSNVTAITVVGGVEPILAASPGGGRTMTLSPWNLGSLGGDGAGANP